MTPTFDRVAIAARIRALVAGQDGGDPEVTAHRLAVDEIGFRMSIDDLAPNPTIEVVAALVASYGVDPCWLLFGEHDPATHRSILENPGSVREAVSRLMLPVVRHSDALRVM